MLRLQGEPWGFLVGPEASTPLAPAALDLPAQPDGRAGRSSLLSLEHPLALGDQPLLLLLENADALPEALLVDLERLLTTAERQALRQRRPGADRSRHLAGRALVRLVLGTLLQHPAQTLPLERNAHGKPRLAPGPWPGLQFNLSHSGSLLLLGVHRQRPIGVDLERHRHNLRWQRIARRYFCPATVQALEATPDDQQVPAFSAAWCELEASLKAEGRGLASWNRRQAQNTAGGQNERPHLFRPWLPSGYSGAVALAGG